MSSDLPSSFLSSKLTADFQKKAGKAVRSRLPFDALLQTTSKAKRPDTNAILKAQNSVRIPKLIPIRHARMAQSPFAFFRGSAAIMAADLGCQPNTGIAVQACGDMHVANFGVFATAERNLNFAINDFDETHIAPWEWDLKRLVASAYIASAYLGGNSQQCEEAVMAGATSYKKWMRRYAKMGNLELWYSHIGEEEILQSLSKEASQTATNALSKARKRTNLQVLEKLTGVVDEQFRIKENYPFIYHDPTTINNTPVRNLIDLLLQQYSASLPPERRNLLSKYTLRDIVRKVVGVGSVGTSCWMIYLQGEDPSDPLFLQFKEAQRSVLEPYTQPCTYANQGERVVFGQRLIQGSPDIFLGYGKLENIDFYIRQLRDMKGGIDIEPGKARPAYFPEYVALCGHALALAHAKAGSAAMISGYIGKSDDFANTMVQYAHQYSIQNQLDYDHFLAAIKSGKFPIAETAK